MIDTVGPHHSMEQPALAENSLGMSPAMKNSITTQKRPAQSRPDEFPLDWRGLLRSFQRRWFVCLSLGLILGLIGAAAAWRLIPTPYVAEAEFHIKAYDDALMFNTKERHANFHTRKQTFQRLLRGREVITAALRDPKASAGMEKLAPDAPDPVDWLSKNVEINNQANEFFVLSLSGEYPDALANVVNAIAESFIQKEVYGAQEQRLVDVDRLEKGLGRTELQLSEKHKALKKMFERSQSANPEMAQQRHGYLLEVHAGLRQQLGDIELELIKARAQQKLLEGEPIVEGEPIGDEIIDAHAMQNPVYQELASRVEKLRTYKRRSARNFTPGHPQIAESEQILAAAEAELQQLRDELRPQIREQLQNNRRMAGELSTKQLQDHIRELENYKVQYEQRLDEIKIEEKTSGLMTIELEQLDQDIALLESMAARMKNEIAHRKFELHTPQLPIEIFEDAEPPHTPDIKKRVMGTGVAGLGLFGMAIAGIVLLDWRTRRISSVDELSGELPLRLMGTIPAMPRSALTDTASSNRQVQKNLFWQSAFKESIDAARTLLVSESERVGHRVIMVGSACSSEGKTTLASHLATSLARAGRQVILVDCDLRRPSVHRVFGIDEGPGICEILRSEYELPETIQEGAVAGLDILPAGGIDATALEYLSSNALAPVFAKLRDDYDFVIVDSSPVLPVCDALLVAQLTDGVMVSVRRDVSRMDNVTAAIKRFTSIGTPVLGAVTIGLDDDPIGYGGYFRSRARLRYGRDYLVGAH